MVVKMLDKGKCGPLLAHLLHKITEKKKKKTKKKTEDHWSYIAHLSAEDMLKSAVIGEKKLGRGRQPVRAKILMSTRRPHHYGHLLQV